MPSTVHAFSHVEWDPERFGIGIKQIDDQHKQLISIINTLSSLVHETYEASAAQMRARADLNQTSMQHVEVAQTERGLGQSGSPSAGAARFGVASRAATPVAHQSTPSTQYGRGLPSSSPRGAAQPQGPAGAALRSSVIGGSPTNVLSPRPASTDNTNVPRHAPEGVPIVSPLNLANAYKIAQGQPDLYTPASHLRSFRSCYQKGSAVWECLGRLVSYCLRSLAAEDHILETYAYADRATQMQEHEAFGEQICRYHKLCEEYALEEEDLLHLLVFLKLWVREHIPRDRRYAPLLLEKGVGS